MTEFAPAKLELRLYLVTLLQEFLGMAHLDHVIVRIDIDSELDFFEFRSRRLPVLVLLREIVAIFAEIYDLTYWRICARGYFHQVQAERLRSAQRVLNLHYPQLFVGCSQDDANLARANSAVYTNLLLLNKTVLLKSETG